jgi:arylsulfatase
MEFILRRRDPTVPFFLMTSFSKPHPPFDPPAPYDTMYLNEEIPEPVVGDWADEEAMPFAMRRTRNGCHADRYTPEIIRAARAAYYGMITQIDYNLGRVLAALRHIGDSRSHAETLILFVSDHGEYLLDHRSVAKSFHHDVSARVPLMIHYPDGWERGLYGTRTDALATHADLLPTILAEVGGEVPGDVDGVDLTAVVEGRAPAREYLEMQIGPDPECGLANVSITDGRWKYCWFPEGSYEHLFDMETDPRECRNLAGHADGQEARTRLRAELTRRLVARGSPYTRGGELVSSEKNDQRQNGRWPLRDYIPGNTVEVSPLDVKH